MLTFDSPQYLLLMLLFPIIWFVRYKSRHSGGGISFSFMPWGERGDYLSILWLDILLVIERLILWGGLFLLILALAGPNKLLRREEFANRGMDIMVVLDHSPSMAALDFGVENRLESAKNMIFPFVNSRDNDSFGLVSFGSEAELLVPPTVDYQLFLNQLKQLGISSMDQGTAIGMGLSLGILHLSSSTASRKIILLLTDGENNAGEIQPTTAISMARQLGISIYTIGIGTSGETALEFVDPESGKIISGRLNSQFDEGLLKTIAQETGGKYYRAISNGTLSTIFRNIDNQEISQRLTRLKVEKQPLHRTFISAGLYMVLLAFFIRKILFREVL
jgi:Ca-activated chloride channel family protein